MLDSNLDRAETARSSERNYRSDLVDMSSSDSRDIFNRGHSRCGRSNEERTSYLNMDDPFSDPNEATDNVSDNSEHSGGDRHRHRHHGHHEKESEEVEQLAKKLLEMIKEVLAQMSQQKESSDEQSELPEDSSDFTPPASSHSSSEASSNQNESSQQTEASHSSETSGQSSDSQAHGGDTHQSTGSQTAPTHPDTGNSKANPATLDAIWAQQDRSQAKVFAEGDSAQSNHLNSTHTDVPSAVPTEANGFSAWGIVLGENGVSVDRNSSAQVKNMQTYVHFTNGGWQKLEDVNDASNNSRIEGMTETTDFKNTKQITVDHSDGIASMAAPSAPGMMNHFGIANETWTPGKFTPGTIDGVYITAEAKANENNSGLLAKLGGDWWNTEAQDGKPLIGVPGTSNFVRLTDQWQPLYYTNLNLDKLKNDPPPGVGSNYAGGIETGSSSGAGLDSSTKGTERTEPQQSSPDTNTGDSTSAMKMIAPFPSTDAQWQTLINSAPEGSYLFPMYSGDNTKPNDYSSFGSGLAQNIEKAANAGYEPIGYIGTDNGRLPLDEVKRRIDLWYEHAGSLKGIYVGASGKPDGSGYQTDPESIAYYSAIADYIHSKGGKALLNGMYMNGGTLPDELINRFDSIGVHEGYLDSIDKVDALRNQLRRYPSSKFFAFFSGVSSAQAQSVVQRMRDDNVGNVWITDIDYGANPSYLSDEINYLH